MHRPVLLVTTVTTALVMLSFSEEEIEEPIGGWKHLCYMCSFTPRGRGNDTDVRVISVDFNAWEYSGCDNLWAGIVRQVGDKVEEYFGKWNVRYCRFLMQDTRKHGAVTDEEKLRESCSCGYVTWPAVFLWPCFVCLVTLCIAAMVWYFVGGGGIGVLSAAIVALLSLGISAILGKKNIISCIFKIQPLRV